MSNELKGLYKFGGVAFIVSGLLFLATHLLDALAGPPPSSGAEIIAWVESGRLALSLGVEVLFFATVSLVPAVIALYPSLASTDRTKAATGCGILAVVIPVLAVLLIVQGRLVYPVYGIHINSPAVAELIVALFFGGLHAIALLLAFATFVLSLAMRKGAYGARVASLGFAAVISDVIGAYPDRIGPMPMIVCQAVSAAWFVAVGLKLYRMTLTPPASPRLPPQGPAVPVRTVDVDGDVDVNASNHHLDVTSQNSHGGSPHADFPKTARPRARLEFLALTFRIPTKLPRGHAGITDQMRRAALSIPLNVAEGAGRTTRPASRGLRDGVRCHHRCAHAVGDRRRRGARGRAGAS